MPKAPETQNWQASLCRSAGTTSRDIWPLVETWMTIKHIQTGNHQVIVCATHLSVYVLDGTHPGRTSDTAKNTAHMLFLACCFRPLPLARSPPKNIF